MAEGPLELLALLNTTVGGCETVSRGAVFISPLSLTLFLDTPAGKWFEPFTKQFVACPPSHTGIDDNVMRASACGHACPVANTDDTNTAAFVTFLLNPSSIDVAAYLTTNLTIAFGGIGTGDENITASSLRPEVLGVGPGRLVFDERYVNPINQFHWNTLTGFREVDIFTDVSAPQALMLATVAAFDSPDFDGGNNRTTVHIVTPGKLQLLTRPTSGPFLDMEEFFDDTNVTKILEDNGVEGTGGVVANVGPYEGALLSPFSERFNFLADEKPRCTFTTFDFNNTTDAKELKCYASALASDSVAGKILPTRDLDIAKLDAISINRAISALNTFISNGGDPCALEPTSEMTFADRLLHNFYIRAHLGDKYRPACKVLTVKINKDTISDGNLPDVRELPYVAEEVALEVDEDIDTPLDISPLIHAFGGGAGKQLIRSITGNYQISGEVLAQIVNSTLGGAINLREDGMPSINVEGDVYGTLGCLPLGEFELLRIRSSTPFKFDPDCTFNGACETRSTIDVSGSNVQGLFPNYLLDADCVDVINAGGNSLSGIEVFTSDEATLARDSSEKVTVRLRNNMFKDPIDQSMCLKSVTYDIEYKYTPCGLLWWQWLLIAIGTVVLLAGIGVGIWLAVKYCKPAGKKDDKKQKGKYMELSRI